MTDVHWEDPPESAKRKTSWWTKRFAEELAQHPGKWARVIGPTGQDTFGSSHRKVLINHGLETRMSTLDADGSHLPPGTFRLWARWPDDVEQ